VCTNAYISNTFCSCTISIINSTTSMSALLILLTSHYKLTSFKRQINLIDLRKYLKGSATDIRPIYLTSLRYQQAARQRKLSVFSPQQLATRRIVDAVRSIVCCEWRLRHRWLILMYQCGWIAFISQVVSLLLSSRTTIDDSAALYVLWCPSSSCAVFQLYVILSERKCLLNCAHSTHHSFIDPLGHWDQLFHLLLTQIMRFGIFKLHGNIARWVIECYIILTL